jgi:O-antigen/teichoic acid export membrane protein
LLNAYLAIAVPRAARAYNAGGHKALMAFLVPISIAMALPLVAYLGLISLLGSRLLALLYGPGQSQASVLIWLFSLTYLAQYAIRVQSVYLLAQGRSRAIFVARTFSIALTFTLGLGLIWFFDVYGALVGLLTSALGMVFVLGWCLWRGDAPQERRSSAESPPQLVTAGGGS